MAESKNILKSKTFWFNILAAITQFTQVIPNSEKYIIPGVVVGNIILRSITDQPVTILPATESK